MEDVRELEYKIRDGDEITLIIKGAQVLPRVNEVIVLDRIEYVVTGVIHPVHRGTMRAQTPIIEVEKIDEDRPFTGYPV